MVTAVCAVLAAALAIWLWYLNHSATPVEKDIDVVNKQESQNASDIDKWANS